jgi:hypothetical protein
MWQLKEHLRRVVGQHLGAPSSFMNGPSDEMKKIIVALTLQVPHFSADIHSQWHALPRSTRHFHSCKLLTHSIKSHPLLDSLHKVGELEAEVTSLRDERAAMLMARRSSAEQPAEIAPSPVNSALAEEKVGPIRPQIAEYDML